MPISTSHLAIIISCISTLLLIVFYVPAANSDAVNQLPKAIKGGYAILGASTFLVNFVLSLFLYRLAVGREQNVERARRLSRWMMFLSIATLSMAVLPSLYVAGFTHKVAALIDSYFPNLATKAKDTISNLITMLVSGVVGNFAYDMLRRLIMRLTKKHLEGDSSGGAASK